MLLVLVGCSSDDRSVPRPTETPTNSASATETPRPPAPSPTTSPTAPAAPESMSAGDLEGAKAAADYFMALYTHARVSGDATRLSAMSGAECSTCAAIVTQVDSARANGHSATGYAIEIREAIATELVPGETYTVEMKATEGPATVHDRSGNVVAESGETRRVLKMGLRWTGEWTVEALSVEVDA
ncbi:DUF6318 family protein [Cellulomonas iranensis]|nr:DUF6318 family protein [Cellulomonas iranensis]